MRTTGAQLMAATGGTGAAFSFWTMVVQTEVAEAREALLARTGLQPTAKGNTHVAHTEPQGPAQQRTAVGQHDAGTSATKYHGHSSRTFALECGGQL